MATKTAVQSFLNTMDSVLLNYPAVIVKSTIGDSTNNNRVPTVSQMIRFLNTIGSSKLATNLSVSYDVLKEALYQRRSSTSRTDAFDINELLDEFEARVVHGSTEVKRRVGKLLVNAA